jgi:hypothetical protein
LLGATLAFSYLCQGIQKENNNVLNNTGTVFLLTSRIQMVLTSERAIAQLLHATDFIEDSLFASFKKF